MTPQSTQPPNPTGSPAYGSTNPFMQNYMQSGVRNDPSGGYASGGTMGTSTGVGGSASGPVNGAAGWGSGSTFMPGLGNINPSQINSAPASVPPGGFGVGGLQQAQNTAMEQSQQAQNTARMGSSTGTPGGSYAPPQGVVGMYGGLQHAMPSYPSAPIGSMASYPPVRTGGPDPRDPIGPQVMPGNYMTKPMKTGGADPMGTRNALMAQLLRRPMQS